jgi:hypothetical protein
VILPPNVLLALVCGGRRYENEGLVHRALDAFRKKALVNHTNRPLWIVQGGGRGADLWASTWAASRETPCLNYPAQWSVLKNAAGPTRNEAMKRLQPDVVIAFPGGTGTAHMARIAEEAGIPVWRVGQ